MMTKLPNSHVAQRTIRTSARRVDDGLSISHQADPVEVIIIQNLSECIDHKRVDADSAWLNFMDQVS